MTTVYFIRHAESDNRIREDLIRPLTEKGLADRALVTQYLGDKQIKAAYSSPYKRAYDTIAPFALDSGLQIIPIDQFKERRIGTVWIEDFKIYSIAQWADFNHKLSDGESLQEVQTRNIQALNKLLTVHPDEAIVIGTHGAALSTIFNYYDPTFDYDRFNQIVSLMPWVVRIDFEGQECKAIESINLFDLPLA